LHLSPERYLQLLEEIITLPYVAPLKRPTPHKKMSCLDAAVQVLADSPTPLTRPKIAQIAQDRGLWKPRKGKTPQQTIGGGITREIQSRGSKSRFKRTKRGQYSLTINA
jgi:hypothetical protein